MTCPICGTQLITIEDHHTADKVIICQGCGAEWSEGKEPEE